MSPSKKALIIGISGCSSSGKSTLARLLREIWPGTFILHEDDFYWPEGKIPIKNGVLDWDCLEAIDLSSFRQALEYIRDHGTSPPELHSKEDRNALGESHVDRDVVTRWQEKARDIFAGGGHMPPIAVIDGFLLYSRDMKEIWELLDVRLFLRTGLSVAKARREARSGYVTIEGFWKDPPGYVDDVVWPNYVKEHAFLFVDGDVEGTIDAVACKNMNIQIMSKSMEGDMTACLSWACELVHDGLANSS